MKIYPNDKVIIKNYEDLYNPLEVSSIKSMDAVNWYFPNNSYGKIAFSFNEGVNQYTFDLKNNKQVEVNEETLLPIDDNGLYVPGYDFSLNILDVNKITEAQWLELKNVFPKIKSISVMIALKSECQDNNTLTHITNYNDFISNGPYEVDNTNKYGYLSAQENLILITDNKMPPDKLKYFNKINNFSFDWSYSNVNIYWLISFNNGISWWFWSQTLKSFEKSLSNDINEAFTYNKIPIEELLNLNEINFIENVSGIKFAFLIEPADGQNYNFQIKSFNYDYVLNKFKYSTDTFITGDLVIDFNSKPITKVISPDNNGVYITEVGNKITITNTSNSPKELRITIVA